MICNHCRRESNPVSHVCPYCGQFMGEEKPLIRGDSVPIYDDSDYRPAQGREALGGGGRRRPPEKRRPRKRRRAGRRRDAYRRHMVNWAMVGLVILILGFVGVVGGYIYLNVTPDGQLILARAGRDASADAYWALGTEYLDQGYIARSIAAYEKAEKLQPEREDLVQKLMLLGEAYEAAGETAKAEAVYTRIYSELAPEDPIGYRNAIRLLLQDEDKVLRAVNLMREAHEKTGDESFYKQRAAMVPLPPTASQSSGRHLKSLRVEFISPQGYDIRYTTSPTAPLEEFQLYTGPITMGEGVHEYRAVCTSRELYSDEMTVRYIVTLPSPPAPKSNLQPGSYKAGRTVRLRDMEEDKTDPLKKSTIYYTLDGRPANTDSPRYTPGEDIRLPSGKPTLRAVAVNGYGKMSNELNITYYISGKPIKYFHGKDEFTGFSLVKTSYEDFIRLYGEPQSSEPVSDSSVTGSCVSGRWAWGEARFVTLDTGQMLYYIDTNDPGMTGPRGTKVGMGLTEVIGRFRDMLQPPNDKGDRGLYYDISAGHGAYRVASDDPTTGTLSYVATLFDEISTTRMLDYQIVNDRVTRIVLKYFDHRISNVQ